MNESKWYKLGNRDIALTPQEAEDLRVLLMEDYIRQFIIDRINRHADELKFKDDDQRNEFIDTLLHMNDDYINFDLYQKETMDENIFMVAEEWNIER